MTGRHLTALAIAATTLGPTSAKATVGKQTRENPQTPQTSVPVGGVVVDVSGQPITRASVRLGEISQSRYYTEITDEAGRFRFGNVEQGRYILASWSSGYPLVHHGATFLGEPGVPVTLVAGKPPDDFTITLRKGGAISGTVRDEFGDPIGATVFARHPLGGLWSGRTDQQGRYRLPYLPPGNYVVGIEAGMPAVTSLDANGQERQVKIGAAWYGGSSASAALPVRIGVESDITGIDVVARYLPAAPLTVTVHAPGPMRGQLQLAIRAEGETAGRVASDQQWDGTTYRFDGIAAGRYTLVASGTVDYSGRTEMLRGRVDTTLDGFAPATITVELERGAQVSGRLIFEGKTTPPKMVPAAFLKSMTGSSALADGLMIVSGGTLGRPEGVFIASSMTSVIPGEYVVQISSSGLRGWMAISATLNGQEILDVPIQFAPNSVSAITITVSDRVTELSGRVTDAESRPQPGLTLVVFSADRRHWYPGSRRIQQALPDARGDYRIGGLSPGDYWLAAITGGLDLPNGLVAGLTELSAAAIRFSLAPGEQKRQDLRTGKGSGFFFPGGLFALSDRALTDWGR